MIRPGKLEYQLPVSTGFLKLIAFDGLRATVPYGDVGERGEQAARNLKCLMFIFADFEKIPGFKFENH
jgi:hypothetical protein